jgi:signal transduction histidine kinase/ActR/RegA family two-component response regulator
VEGFLAGNDMASGPLTSDRGPDSTAAGGIGAVRHAAPGGLGGPYQHLNPVLFGVFGLPLLTGVYVAAAKLGLSLATSAEQVSAVWPPAGIALAAVLLLGYRAWPAIMLGAFLANFTTHESAATALGIAAGNTLEAVAGAWLLRRIAQFDGSLARLTDVLALVVLAAAVSTALAATIGVTSLCLGGAQPWSSFGSLWGVWWLGDAMGDLIIAPLLLTWATDLGRPKRIAEAGVLLAILMLVSWLGFSAPSRGSGEERTWIYCMFPLVTWAALRFGQRGTTVVTLVASALAIWSTFRGLGPFGTGLIHDRLLSLQLFIGVVSTSALLLSAALAEREHLEDELRVRLGQLAGADRRKDEFLAMLAHELRNPLAPIQNALEILQLPSASPAIIAEAEEILGRQVQHLVRLVDDLLDMARISRGKIELRKERLALETVVARAIETARPLIDARGHELTVALPAEPVTIEADPTRLAQVISNLLNNAAKYSESRGHIWLTARRDGDRLAIQVRDQGIGISPDVLPSIFDLFVQAERGRDRTHGGMGIGLTLVRRLVELHGGAVEAFSAGPGKGSEFTIRLPFEAPTPPSAESRAPISRIATTNRWARPGRILIVDDNADAAATLARLLRNRGYETHVLFDGPSALEWADAHRPAVVILDIGMPKMDGYEVARRLRQKPGGDDLLLIALSGWGQEEDRRRSSDAGFDAHLIKPVDLAALEGLFGERKSLPAPTRI